MTAEKAEKKRKIRRYTHDEIALATRTILDLAGGSGRIELSAESLGERLSLAPEKVLELLQTLGVACLDSKVDPVEDLRQRVEAIESTVTSFNTALHKLCGAVREISERLESGSAEIGMIHEAIGELADHSPGTACREIILSLGVTDGPTAAAGAADTPDVREPAAAD